DLPPHVRARTRHTDEDGAAASGNACHGRYALGLSGRPERPERPFSASVLHRPPHGTRDFVSIPRPVPGVPPFEGGADLLDSRTQRSAFARWAGTNRRR